MASRRPIRVLVADDHTVIRQGIVGILKASQEIEVVAEASDGDEATRKTVETRPDVVVLDVSMPRLNGIEAARRIREVVPETRVLILTMHDDEEYIVQALRAGASGCLLKDGAGSELIAGIRALKQGKSYFAPRAFQALARACRIDSPAREGAYALLTGREREVFQLVVEGKTNTQIGEILSISPKTVDNHRTHLMDKLQLHSRTELIRYAARYRLL